MVCLPVCPNDVAHETTEASPVLDAEWPSASANAVVEESPASEFESGSVVTPLVLALAAAESWSTWAEAAVAAFAGTASHLAEEEEA